MTRAGQQSDRGIQAADTDRFSRQGVIPGNIASENRHGADAEAQGEEGLSHGGVYHLKPSVFLNLSEVGNQIEADALSGAWAG